MRKLSHITILDEYAVDMNIVLGQGSTGCVYQGLNMKTSNKVAVKIVDLRTMDNEVALYLLNMEKTALMIVSSQFVLQGLKVAQDSRYCFMITEFCNGGTLKKQIRNSVNGYLSQQRSLSILHHLLLGYRSLVEKGITHRDLKPANIMFHDGIPKIIDFGYCQIKGFAKPSMQYNVGSPSYMAPQSFQSNIYNQKTQIWAFGVILFECLTGKTIDEGRHMSEVYYEIEMSGVPYPVHVSYYARNIINWCLSKSPKNRPTCSQLLQSYFTNKNRSKSNLVPPKTEVTCQTDLRSYQFSKYVPSKQFKTLKEAQINKIPTSKTEEMILKTTRHDNKFKSYKIPDFLQASKKIKQESKQNRQPRLKACFSNFDKQSAYNAYQTSRPVTKMGKTEKAGHHFRSKQKIFKNQNLFATTYQYGDYALVKNHSNLFESNKKDEVDALYGKIKNIQTKNRVVSSHAKLSPDRYLKKTPSQAYDVIASKQYALRAKRTFTQRNKLLRA